MSHKLAQFVPCEYQGHIARTDLKSSDRNLALTAQFSHVIHNKDNREAAKLGERFSESVIAGKKKKALELLEQIEEINIIPVE